LQLDEKVGGLGGGGDHHLAARAWFDIVPATLPLRGIMSDRIDYTQRVIARVPATFPHLVATAADPSERLQKPRRFRWFVIGSGVLRREVADAGSGRVLRL
jgi:hypothetical protein